MSGTLASPGRAMFSVLFCCFLLITIVALTADAFAADSQKPVDVIFVNGDIYVGAAIADRLPRFAAAPLPRVQALAVREGRIVAAGANTDIKKLKSKHTEVVDLGGHFVMPGLSARCSNA
jgi:hypothetical protein